MKTVPFALSVVLISMTAFAGDGQVPMAPDWVSYDKAKQNFDGSFSFTNPRLDVNGEMVRILAPSAAGFCKLLKLRKVHSTPGLKLEKGEDLASLADYDGELEGIYNSEDYDVFPLQFVVCRRVR